MTTAKKGLHAKLAEIRGALNGQIRKTGEHTQGGPRYSFVEALEVGRQFIEEASARGVTMVPETMELTDVRPSVTGKQHVSTIKVTWRITDAETGETLTVESFGQGADNSDKALPKAQTNAMKYAILMLLQAAGDDPEKDEPEAPAKTRARRTAIQRRSRPSTDEPVIDYDGDDDGKVYEDKPRTRRRPQRQEEDPEPGVRMATKAFKAKIRARQHEEGLTDAQFKEFGRYFTGKESSTEWTEADADRVMAELDKEASVELFLEVKGAYVAEPDSVAGGN